MENIVSNNKQYLRKLLIIAVPIMLSNVISQLQMIIDRIFLGQMNTLYMSALGNVTSPMWTSMSFCFSLAMGASILISQNVGAGDKEKVEYYAAALFKWNNVIPIALFIFWLFCGEKVFGIMGVSENVMPMCLDYSKYFSFVFLVVGLESSFSIIMQTSNYTKPMVWFGVIRAGLNIFLDYVLIFGKFGFPQMGIKGAAIATTIAEFCGALFGFVILLGKPLPTRPSFGKIVKARVMPFIEAAKLGINIAFEDFAWNLGNLILIRILNSINEMAAGIYSIVFSVEVLVVVIVASIGNATMTLSGEAKGSNDKKQFVQISKISYILCAIVSVIMLIVGIIWPQNLLAMFSSDEQIIKGCGIYIVLVCINLFSKSGNIIVGNSIRGSGDTKWMFYTQMFGTVLVVGCACVFVFAFGWGIIGVFCAVLVDEFIRCMINLYKLIYIVKGWDAIKA